MASTSTTAKGQRMSGKDRREAILAAGAEVFVEYGFERANIDSIIERVGGSKRTIYDQFGNKEGLFTAVVLDIAGGALLPLAEIEATGRDLRSDLESFGCKLLDAVMSPRVTALFRVVVAEGRRFPNLARAFYEGGPEQACRRLETLLARYRDAGEIDIGDCAAAAELFVGMMRGELFLAVVLGLREPPTPEETERLARLATTIFLDGLDHRG